MQHAAVHAPFAALMETEARTPLVAPTDAKVSATPSSNSFARHADGIPASHPMEPDMRNAGE
jgi:hypothetical protein